jgi:two-component system, chemotaxis family, protein-glutamate methylesterase/glutaminase
MKAADLNKKYKAIVIGGSAGSFQVLCKILNQLPEDFSLPIIICCHRLKHIRNGFMEALSLKSIKEVREPEDKEPIKRGKVYLAPSNYHMYVEIGHTIGLSTEEMVNNSRPAIDLTFETAAYVYRDKMIGILLTGANKDGALGMKKVKDNGGLTIVQDPAESVVDTMPKSALAITQIDYVFKVEEIIKFLIELNKYQN